MWGYIAVTLYLLFNYYYVGTEEITLLIFLGASFLVYWYSACAFLIVATGITTFSPLKTLERLFARLIMILGLYVCQYSVNSSQLYLSISINYFVAGLVIFVMGSILAIGAEEAKKP